MSDLASLMQVAPTTASGFMGINQSNQEISDRLKQRELADLIAQRAAEAQQTAQMNPLKMRQQELVNQGLETEMPGKAAKAKKEGLDVSLQEATQPSNILATVAKNTGVLGDEKEKDRERAQKLLLSAGAELRSTAAPLRAAAFKEMIKNGGMNPDNPQLQQFLTLAQQNPEGFPDAVDALANRLGQQATAMSPTAQAHIKGAQIGANASIRGHEISAGATTEAARIAAKSRTDVASAKAAASAKDILSRVKSGDIKSYEHAATSFRILSDLTDDPEEKAKYKKLSMQFEQAVKDKPTGKPSADLEKMGIAVREQTSAFDNDKPKVGTTSSGVKYKVVGQ